MTPVRAGARMPRGLVIARWLLIGLGVLWLASWWYPPARGPQLTPREVFVLASQPGGPPSYLQEPFELTALATGLEANQVVLDDGSIIHFTRSGKTQAVAVGQLSSFRVVLVGVTGGHLHFEAR